MPGTRKVWPRQVLAGCRKGSDLQSSAAAAFAPTQAPCWTRLGGKTWTSDPSHSAQRENVSGSQSSNAAEPETLHQPAAPCQKITAALIVEKLGACGGAGGLASAARSDFTRPGQRRLWAQVDLALWYPGKPGLNRCAHYIEAMQPHPKLTSGWAPIWRVFPDPALRLPARI